MSNVIPMKRRSPRPVPVHAIVELIQAHIAASPVVLFMKGSPDFAQCGHSARVVDALRACGADFEHVDILENAQLRESLKTYSNWPTFPQLYVDREFIGGCDIVLQMQHSGELVQVLRDSQMRFAPAV